MSSGLFSEIDKKKKGALERALIDSWWNVKKAAGELNISRQTAHTWIKRFKIRKPKRP